MSEQKLVNLRMDGKSEVYHTGRCDMLGDTNTSTNYTLVPLWLAERAGLRLCGKCPEDS